MSDKALLAASTGATDHGRAENVVAIRQRLASWPHDGGWATNDIFALLRMVDELRAKLALCEANESAYVVELEQVRAKLAEAEHYREKHKRQSRGWEEVYDKACAKLKEVEQRERLHHGADLTRAQQRAEAAEARVRELETGQWCNGKKVKNLIVDDGFLP